MRFYQQYTYNEYLYGEQSVLFVVSDIYEEIYTPVVGSNFATDIFILDTVKSDLNTEEGSFAIDEMTLSVNQLSCKNETDEKAMFFCLDAADVNVNRYCAVFFGEDPLLADQLFVGKLGSKISGDDKVWSGGEFAFIVNPKREYKLTAYSYDISLLETVKLAGDIFDLEGTPIKNIYERWEDESWATIKTIFDYRLSYAYKDVNPSMIYNCPLGNLYKVLNEYLSRAADVLLQLNNTDFTFNLVETSLGIHTCPVSYTLVDYSSSEIQPPITAEQTIRIELKLSDTDNGTDWCVPFIHRKMIDPTLGNSMTAEWQKGQASNELSYSFRSIDNMSDLLYEIARCFALYIFVTYTTETTFNFEFKSRKGIVEDDYTYIIGASDAGLDTSSIIVKNANEYFGLANSYAVDGFDEVKNKPNTNQAEPSDLFKKKQDKISLDKKKRGMESERLMLTTSATTGVIVCTGRVAQDFTNMHYWAMPLNNIGTDFGLIWNVLYTMEMEYLRLTSNMPEHIHTGIYVMTKPMEADQIARLGAETDIWRPALKIFTQSNGADLDFETLSLYCDYVMGRDKHYYETEYSITVPFWNGFSKNSDGSDNSWQKIKRGSKMKLAETVRRYAVNHWTSITGDITNITVVDTGHNLTSDDWITVYGVTPGNFNGHFHVTVIDLNTFTYANYTGYEGTGSGGYYIVDGETPWVEEQVQRDYIVVGIEFNLKTPETKLKLHSLERFAFGYWDGNEGLLPPMINTNGYENTESDDTVTTKTYIIETGEVILLGDAVMLLDTGTIAKTQNYMDYHEKTIGIALQAGVAADTIIVQLSRRVQLDVYTFTNIGSQIFARTNGSGINLSEDILTEADESQQIIIIMGKIDSANSFILNIEEFSFEYVNA